MALSIFNGLFLVVYLVCAVAQVNDPDPLPWIAIYAMSAGMCALWFRQDARRSLVVVWLTSFLLVISLAWIATLLPALAGDVSWGDIFESVSMRTRAVEEAREIGGLFLVTLWSAVLVLVVAQNKRKR